MTPTSPARRPRCALRPDDHREGDLSASKTPFGWYRAPVTVRFSCRTHGSGARAPLPRTGALHRNGAGKSVTRTISAVNGGAASVTVRGINIDRTWPTVGITGIRNGRRCTTAGRRRCAAPDATRFRESPPARSPKPGMARARRTATATDRAGNTRTISGSYTTLPIFVYGATYSNGAFNVRAGGVYVLVGAPAGGRRTTTRRCIPGRRPTGNRPSTRPDPIPGWSGCACHRSGGGYATGTWA